MKINPYRSARSVPALAVATRTNGTVNGITVDRYQGGANDYRGGVLFTIHTGTITDGSVAIAVQDSPDSSTWTAVTGTDVQGATTIVTTNDDTVLECGYSGPQRYVRLSVTTSGATTGGSFGATAVMFGGRRHR
jgi:hypothetical protein